MSRGRRANNGARRSAQRAAGRKLVGRVLATRQREATQRSRRESAARRRTWFSIEAHRSFVEITRPYEQGSGLTGTAGAATNSAQGWGGLLDSVTVILSGPSGDLKGGMERRNGAYAILRELAPSLPKGTTIFSATSQVVGLWHYPIVFFTTDPGLKGNAAAEALVFGVNKDLTEKLAAFQLAFERQQAGGDSDEPWGTCPISPARRQIPSGWTDVTRKIAAQ